MPWTDRSRAVLGLLRAAAERVAVRQVRGHRGCADADVVAIAGVAGRDVADLDLAGPAGERRVVAGVAAAVRASARTAVGTAASAAIVAAMASAALGLADVVFADLVLGTVAVTGT